MLVLRMVAGSILDVGKCSVAFQQSDGDGVKTLFCSPRYDALLFLLSISRFGVSALLQMLRTSARSKSFLLRWIKEDGEGFVRGWLCNFATIVEQGGDGRR
jgi:hypothetical protein